MKIKKLFFLLSLLFFSLLSHSQCTDCNDSANNITYSGNGIFTSSDAQAYFWEICEGNAFINGSNTGQTVKVSCRTKFKIKVTRFVNGNCIESCEK